MNKITPTLINIALGIAIGLSVAGIWLIVIYEMDTNKKATESSQKVNYMYERIMKSDINN